MRDLRLLNAAVSSFSRFARMTIPAIAVTANARADDRLWALSAGFHLHIAKPIDPAELTVVIAQMIGGRSA